MSDHDAPARSGRGRVGLIRVNFQVLQLRRSAAALWPARRRLPDQGSAPTSMPIKTFATDVLVPCPPGGPASRTCWARKTQSLPAVDLRLSESAVPVGTSSREWCRSRYQHSGCYFSAVTRRISVIGQRAENKMPPCSTDNRRGAGRFRNQSDGSRNRMAAKADRPGAAGRSWRVI